MVKKVDIWNQRLARRTSDLDPEARTADTSEVGCDVRLLLSSDLPPFIFSFFSRLAALRN
jgi:hypothetical protein